MNADRFGLLKVEWENRHEFCGLPLSLFFFIEKRKNLARKAEEKTSEHFKKTSAFESAESD